MHAAMLEQIQPEAPFIWLVWGCQTKQQAAMFAPTLVHKKGTVRHFKPRLPRDPDTGKTMAEFQASNRPMMVRDWVEKYPKDVPPYATVVLGEPDQSARRRRRARRISRLFKASGLRG